MPSPFKASHFTRWSSLKRISGMQLKLLSLWMGKHQILQNGLPSLRLNFIFKITNKIWQHACFEATSQCECAVLSVRLRMLTVSIATGASKSSYSDAMTLPIGDWLFYSEGGASFDRAAILRVAFLPIQNYMSGTSWGILDFTLCVRERSAQPSLECHHEPPFSR